MAEWKAQTQLTVEEPFQQHSPYVIGALVPAVTAALVNAIFALWQVKKPRLLTSP